MKTQTQVEIRLNSLQPFENFHIEPQGYVLKFFMGCSEIYSKPFKIKESDLRLNEVLKIKNILGDQIEIWLCNLQDKIIAYTSLQLIKQGQQFCEIELKLNAILFAKLDCSLEITRREIEKVVYVQPDEQLLKKQEDPEAVRLREEQHQRKIREQQQQERLAQKEKKYPITITHRNKINQPFQ